MEQVPLLRGLGVGTKSLWCHCYANRQTELVAGGRLGQSHLGAKAEHTDTHQQAEKTSCASGAAIIWSKAEHTGIHIDKGIKEKR